LTNHTSTDLLNLKPEASALRFSSHQDALDYARHCVENANRRLAAQNLNALDRYIKGEVAAYVSFRSRGSERENHLAFRSIPSKGIVRKEIAISNSANPGEDNICIEGRFDVFDNDGDESKVFVGVSNLVNCPKGIIPSTITLEPFKERADCRWQILASSGHVVPEMIVVASEGKLNGFQRGASRSNSGCISGLVENSAEVVGCIEQNAGEHLRQLSRESDFVNFLSRLRIFINDMGPWVTVDKVADHGIEIIDVILCSLKSEVSTIEDIRHGEQTRSDERSGISKGCAEALASAP
jgi:hypothetical protein